ncbi:MAG: FtsW/RodA/SpoVE family cell cycle protein [Lachnospiraceae bacterium]|nr:FtsW/RodA/SpoVE family cell cycle protein [Lachnospiraceae bacterium]
MKNTRVRKVVGSYDISLLLIVALLCAFGTVMVFSTSYYNADRFYSESTKYYSLQIRNIIFGGASMIMVSLIDYHLYSKRIWRSINLLYVLYVLCMVLQILVVFIGYSSNGAARWLNIGPVGFQPSELTKICIILMSAYLISTRVKYMKTLVGITPMLILFTPLVMLVAYFDLSTGIVLLAIMFVVALVVTGFRKYYLGIFGVMLAGGLVLILYKGYRMERIIDWLNSDTLDTGSQTIQGLYAIASGGIGGKGLGEGIQKLGKIQEVHTDMIFTVVCEELGIIGAITVITLFLLLLWRIYVVAVNARDMFGGLICVGVFAHIATQFILNIMVVTNMIPATGIPLPFISYGGTSLVVLMAEMGLVLNVSKQIPKEGVSDA